MATFVPSKYQKTVYTYITKGKGNAVIDAVAGSGKSTTIVNALKLIPTDKQILFLAFNKSIVEELKIKIGNLHNVEIRTLHSLGMKALLKAYKSQVDDNKYTSWLNSGIQSGFIKPTYDLTDKAGEWKSNILKLIDLGRVNLVRSEQELDELAFKHNLILFDNETSKAIQGIKWGEGETAWIDYTDMVYLPVVKNLRMYQFDWVFIDILFLGALAIFGAVWLYNWNNHQLRNEMHATDKGVHGVSTGVIQLFEFKIGPVRLGMLLFLIISFGISVYKYYPYFI